MPKIDLRSAWPFAATMAIVLSGLGVFGAGLGGGFLFDDIPNLVENSAWKVTPEDFSGWRRAVSSGFSSDLGRPLAMLSFAVNHYFTGMDAFWLKSTGLALHLINGVLVFLLCRRLFALVSMAEPRWRMGGYAAFMVALAWTIHPLQVSSALYIVQRMEVGAHSFVLLSLLAYLLGRTRDGWKTWVWLALSGVLAAAGLGFKETALLTPGYALLIELCLLKFRRVDGVRSHVLVGLYAAGVALALAVFLLWALPHALRPEAYAARDFTLGQRLLTQLSVLAMYLQQILLPIPNSLLFNYDAIPISQGLLNPPSTLRGFLLLLMLAGIAFALRKRVPLVALGIGWFFFAHALTSNVWPLELAFEHRNYFALLGVLIAVAQGMAWATAQLHMDARRTLALLPVVLLAGLCAMQTHAWGDPLRLSMALATRNPDSPRASYDLGTWLLAASNYETDSPAFSLARREFEHASVLPRASSLADQALIVMDARTGRAVPEARWDALREKLSRHAASAEDMSALANLSECRFKDLCQFDDAQLQRSFLVALERNPASAKLHSIHAFYALIALKDARLAIEQARKAMRLDMGDKVKAYGFHI